MYIAIFDFDSHQYPDNHAYVVGYGNDLIKLMGECTADANDGLKWEGLGTFIRADSNNGCYDIEFMEDN